DALPILLTVLSCACSDDDSVGSGGGSRCPAGACIYSGRIWLEGSKSKDKSLPEYQLSLAGLESPPKLLNTNSREVTEGAMTFRNKIYLTIFGILEFIVVLFILGLVAASAAQASDNAGKQEIVTGPEQHEMTLVSLDPWVIEGEV